MSCDLYTTGFFFNLLLSKTTGAFLFVGVIPARLAASLRGSSGLTFGARDIFMGVPFSRGYRSLCLLVSLAM